MNKLKELNLSENTLIIYLGDNGTHVELESQIGNTTIKGGKGLPSDTGTHVPLICAWPGTVEHWINQDLIDSTDFLPTILEVTNTTIENYHIDWQSFLAQLYWDKGNPREWLYFYYEPKNPRRDRLNKEFKFVFARDKKWKLYDDGKLFNLKKF